MTMSCGVLASTGIAAPPIALALAGAALLAVGAVVVLLTRRRHPKRRGRALTAVLALGVVAALLGGSAVAATAADRCPPTSGLAPAEIIRSPLVIRQTVDITDLGPDIPPAEIRGIVVNDNADDTYVTDVVVSIGAVTPSATAPVGGCGAEDYVLAGARMRVEAPLPAGGTVGFSGATIDFVESAENQDACQGATVELLYESSSR